MSATPRFCTLLVIGLMAAALHGCGQTADEVYASINKFVIPPTGQGLTTDAYLDIIYKNRSVPDGTIEIGGKVTPESFDPAPPSAAVDAPLPSTVRLILERKNSVGEVLATRTFDVALQPTGEIAVQSFPWALLFMAIGDQVRLSVQPLGAGLPASSVTLRLHYRRL